MGHEVLNFRYTSMSIPIPFPTLYAVHAKRRQHALESVWPLTYRAGRAVDRIQVGTRYFSLLQNIHAASGSQGSSYSWAPISFTLGGLHFPGLSVHHSPPCSAVFKMEIVRLHFDISTALSLSLHIYIYIYFTVTVFIKVQRR